MGEWLIWRDDETGREEVGKKHGQALRTNSEAVVKKIGDS
jgi:hypothetical protein